MGLKMNSQDLLDAPEGSLLIIGLLSATVAIFSWQAQCLFSSC